MEENLLAWLHENADTEFGRLHHFNTIKNLSDYRREVPLTSYFDYEALIERMCAGEERILTAKPVYCFVTTSGSVGKPKKIPLTKEGIMPFAKMYANVMKPLAGVSGKHIHLSVFPVVPGKCAQETLLTAASYCYLYEKGIFHPASYVGGSDFLFSQEIKDILYVKLWCALFEEQLVSIQSIFLYDVLLFFEYMGQHWAEILSDMERREISVDVQIPHSIKKRLLTELCPSRERILFLRRELSRGCEEIAPRIWKNLCMVSGIGGSFFRSREYLLREFTGGIPWHYFAYGSSECFSAYADGLETPYYTLMPEGGFYEFLDRDTGAAYTAYEVEKQRQYELVVTNHSGLYRYKQGDIVKVVDFQEGMPVIEIIGRNNQVINVAGEKTDSVMLEELAQRFSEEQGVHFWDYAAAVWEEELPMSYLFYIEPQRGPLKQSAQEMSHTFDRLLREINPDYDDLRRLGSLGMPKVICLMRGELERRRRYRNVSQNKPGQTILQRPLP